MEDQILGLHHITAIADNAQRNYDFYTKVLGLRLVKKTVNFDDPGTYHFYYGNERGEPGTILTFFPGKALVKDVMERGWLLKLLILFPKGALNSGKKGSGGTK